ncbi:hypothetical protein L210DRAFT_787436, partial [Boletus edulis BED1]
VLPHGVPLLIHTSSESYGALDFKVSRFSLQTSNNILHHHVHPVFDLVPPALSTFIGERYDALGCPPMTCASAWQVCREPLAVIQEHA